MKLNFGPTTVQKEVTALSATDLEMLVACPQKFHFFTEKRLVSKWMNDNFLLGQTVHWMLANYYASVDPTTTTDEYISSVVDKAVSQGFFYTGNMADLVTTCEEILEYYMLWCRPQDEAWKILAVEAPFELDVTDTRKVHGVIDLLVQDQHTNEIWIVDHKTSGKGPDANNTVQYTFSMQANLYPWALNHDAVFGKKRIPFLSLGYGPVSGIIYNVISKSPPSAPRMLKNGGLSKDKAQRTTAEWYLTEIERLGLDVRDYEEVLASLRERQYNARIPVRFSEGRDEWFSQFLMVALTHVACSVTRLNAAPSYSCSFCDYRSLCEEGVRQSRPWELLVPGGYLQRESFDMWNEEG